jgi:hypothetical protein
VLPTASAPVAKTATETGFRKILPVVRRHPEIWIALVLWLASNLFVVSIAKIATWEGGASYFRAADLCQWDCGWYGSILERGYDHTFRKDGTANWPFHPAFPLSGYPLRHWLKLPLSLSVVLTSKTWLLFAIYGFLLLVRKQMDSTADHFKAGSLVAFNPYIIYAHAGYAEPLYFALAAFAFILAERKHWIASGIAGALLSATRFVGFLFAISYAIVSLRDSNWRRYDLNKLMGLLLCPLGTVLFMLYMYRLNGDALVQLHIQVVWQKTPGNPFGILVTALSSHHWPRVWGVMVLIGLAASVWLCKLRKPEFGIYLALSILIPFSASYWAIARYIWWQPPFLYAIHCALKRYPAVWPIYTAFASGMASFMIWGWFSGHNFVV